ncbi:MAG: hypothetical protein KKE17_06720 [Proteobacteria bacterium]|nr:hypothetical protein [Pseudomonadota bacterium]MBU1709681.1 hypothetical protein [Pseudomonadota bacterium]
MAKIIELTGEEQLAETTEYSFNNRRNVNIPIKIFEIIAGNDKGIFIARPISLITRARKRFVGRGTSKIEALNDCLEKIREKSIAEIFKPVHE